MKKKMPPKDYVIIPIRFKKERWHKISLEAHREHLKTSTWIKKKVLDILNNTATEKE